MSKIIAIIPARAGSKAVKDKNIKLLAKKPLLAYSIRAAQLTKGIDHVIVSTDSKSYADIAKEYKAEVPFLRPKEFSGDSSNDYDFVKHALNWLKDNEDYQPEYLVHLRPTTPLREVSVIEGAIKLMKESDKSVTALRSAHEMPESAYKTFELEENYLKCVGSGSLDIEAANLPRQAYKKTYQANGYVDIIKTSFVLENKKVHGDKVIGYITPHVFEVDTLEDFDYLEYQVSKKPELVGRLFEK